MAPLPVVTTLLRSSRRVSRWETIGPASADPSLERAWSDERAGCPERSEGRARSVRQRACLAGIRERPSRERGGAQGGTLHRDGTRQLGLTLVEIVVAMGIFVLLIGGGTSLFVLLLRSQRSDLGQTTLLGSTQTFLELLEREVRTGFGNTFRCSSSDPINSALTCDGSSFTFTNQENEEVTYTRSGTAIARNGDPVSGTGVEVRELTFHALQSGVDQGAAGQVPILTVRQGRVTVRLRACPAGADDERCLAVQTTLTARQYGPT